MLVFGLTKMRPPIRAACDFIVLADEQVYKRLTNVRE